MLAFRTLLVTWLLAVLADAQTNSSSDAQTNSSSDAQTNSSSGAQASSSSDAQTNSESVSQTNSICAGGETYAGTTASTCQTVCQGYIKMQEDLHKVPDGGDQCTAAQANAETGFCLLHGSGLRFNGCSQATQRLKSLQQCCKQSGVDIEESKFVSSFARTPCMLCSVLQSQVRRITRCTPAECQDFCRQDLGCRGFEYDKSNTVCRIWGRCAARVPDEICAWAIYDRPLSEIPTSSTLPPPSTTTSTTTERKAVVTSIDVAHRWCSPCLLWALVLPLFSVLAR